MFTKQPPKTVYVFRGYDSSLEWKFYNDTIPAEFSFVTWEVYVAGLGWKKLKQENNQGLLIDHSEQPVQFRNRLEKRGQATLVIKNMTFEDSSRYRCILTTFGGTRTESDVEVVVIGMQSGAYGKAGIRNPERETETETEPELDPEPEPEPKK